MPGDCVGHQSGVFGEEGLNDTGQQRGDTRMTGVVREEGVEKMSSEEEHHLIILPILNIKVQDNGSDPEGYRGLAKLVARNVASPLQVPMLLTLRLAHLQREEGVL